MGAFVKKWFHLVLIFVFAYLAGSLAGQAANQFSSAEESTKNAVYEPSQKPVALTENGIPIYSASADGNWGLSFPSPGQAPVGNTTNDYLKQFNACYMGDPGVKVIYLTFDAGYENGNTAKILDALKKHGVHAAFFVVGNYLETSPELVKRMVEEGHIVGNHTYHHPDMSKISDKQSFEKELKDLENLYTQDKQPSKEEAFKKLLGRIHPGAIVLLHSTSDTNGAILDELLTKWEEMGYHFATLDDI